MRGLDLSGTLQGAGGVGGLLAIKTATNGTHFYCHDGNGNVTALVDPDDGSVSALYEYDPFGNELRATGPTAKTNPLRFSGQWGDDITGDLKYLYREYRPSTGRWANRDAIGEHGGKNLYGFIDNTPLTQTDIFGNSKKIKACSFSRRIQLMQAEQRAREGASAAYKVLHTSFNWWSVEERNPRFKDRYSPRNAFASTYESWFLSLSVKLLLIEKGFKENDFTVECECWCNFWEVGKDGVAYISPWQVQFGTDRTIHICSRYFEQTPRRQAETFLHEASHLFAFTDDLAIGGSRPWVKNPEDAYWIENFATENAFSFLDHFVNTFTSLYP